MLKPKGADLIRNIYENLFKKVKKTKAGSSLQVLFF